MEALDLKETHLRAQICREDTSSRRFSKSFRSDIIISRSIASSSGYALNEEIDPSTYSFTKALEALQARNTVLHGWGDVCAEGVALNSKWSEAERYICNPLSGEVPVECLSARTLSTYTLHLGQLQIKPSLVTTHQDQVRLPIQQVTKNGNMERVVWTQSASSIKIASRSLSPTSTPSIEERPIRRKVEESEEESPLSIKNLTFQEQEKCNESSEEVEGIVACEQERKKVSNNKRQIIRWSRRQCGGLLPWWSLWMKRRNQQDPKHRSRKKTFFLCHTIFC